MVCNYQTWNSFRNQTTVHYIHFLVRIVRYSFRTVIF